MKEGRMKGFVKPTIIIMLIACALITAGCCPWGSLMHADTDDTGTILFSTKAPDGKHILFAEEISMWPYYPFEWRLCYAMPDLKTDKHVIVREGMPPTLAIEENNTLITHQELLSPDGRLWAVAWDSGYIILDAKTLKIVRTENLFKGAVMVGPAKWVDNDKIKFSKDNILTTTEAAPRNPQSKD